jgi:hypothetical protein
MLKFALSTLALSPQSKLALPVEQTLSLGKEATAELEASQVAPLSAASSMMDGLEKVGWKEKWTEGVPPVGSVL